MPEPNFLIEKIDERRDQHLFRTLKTISGAVDFSSNDYLGIATNKLICQASALGHGSTGSRLLTGNSMETESTESLIAAFHEAEAGLIFNSGYDANVGVLSCIGGRGDTILYDSLSHASIRDGIRLSFSTSHSFIHNDVADLKEKLQSATGNIFIVTESVFSMDGDSAPLQEIAAMCENFNAYLIVDEAHATGVIGKKGEGLVQFLRIQRNCLARIHTFGKAAGCHGAIVLGSHALRDFLINFSRPFIYTTALPAVTIAAIKETYLLFPGMQSERERLNELILFWKTLQLPFTRSQNETPIQYIMIPGNEQAIQLAQYLREQSIDIRPIRYPSVPRGSERLRVVLHSYNTVGELQKLEHLLHQCTA
ncbi:MAG TPA: 8-amino-7-oxononanoate synthase [Flavitalea sp.]|nr:8-amino-7-oxononanoate synthase [Flavitalea sp.]